MHLAGCEVHMHASREKACGNEVTPSVGLKVRWSASLARKGDYKLPGFVCETFDLASDC